jgi:hypothetical protein
MPRTTTHGTPPGKINFSKQGRQAYDHAGPDQWYGIFFTDGKRTAGKNVNNIIIHDIKRQFRKNSIGSALQMIRNAPRTSISSLEKYASGLALPVYDALFNEPLTLLKLPAASCRESPILRELLLF